jgi:hypothetical protein
MLGRTGRLLRLVAHRFFHVDRSSSLLEGQSIELDSHGLTRFGATYWHSITTKRPEEMDDAERREFILESIRQESKFSHYTSRLSGFFGANTLEDAERFVQQIEPRATNRVPVFEVFASRFWTLDMNWLDYSTDDKQRQKYLREYWYAAISNHNPAIGARKPPLLEVLMAPPIQVGKVVAWIENAVLQRGAA